MVKATAYRLMPDCQMKMWSRTYSSITRFGNNCIGIYHLIFADVNLVEMTERISIMNQYYTYILSNKSDTTLYIGATNDIERRVAEHRSGTIPGFTQKYKCHKLVYFESFSDVEQAIAREKQLKKWSRAKKDALIDTMNKDRTDLLPE